MSALETLAEKWERQAATGVVEGIGVLSGYEREVCTVVAFRLRDAIAEDGNKLDLVEQLRIRLIEQGGRPEVFAIAAELTAILYPDGEPGAAVPRTPYERMDFEREWDDRVKNANNRG